jgi:hypothetical protein
MAQSKGSGRLGASLPANRTRASFQTLFFFKKLDGGQSPKRKKIVSVKFCHAVFCLLDFFTLEDGTDILSQNVS